MTTFGIRLPSYGLGELLRPSGEFIPSGSFNGRLRRLGFVVLGDHGHEVAEIDRRVEIEFRMDEQSMELLGQPAPVLVALGHVLHDACDRVEYLTLRERATLCLTEKVPPGPPGCSR